MKAVKLENISKIYDGDETIKNLTLKVEPGEMISLLGPSGSGKTTTLKIIAGLVEADQGKVLIDDKSIDHLPTQKRGAVIVFQDHRLFPHMTVGANIEFGLRMKRIPKDIRREKVQEMLQFVGLEEHGGKFPAQISGGEKQRVAIARALIVDPEVLLLDEPFSNLDQRLKEEMRSFIVDIQRKLKITTILVTHDKEDALITSSKIGVIFNGELKQYGTPEELYETPKSLDIARFFGEINEIPIVKMDEIFIYTPIGAFSRTLKLQGIKVGEVNKLLLRPEAIILSKAENRNNSGKDGDRHIYNKYSNKNTIDSATRSEKDNGVLGKVNIRTFVGEKTYYEVEAGGLRIRVSVIGKGTWQIGDSVVVHALKESLIFCK